MRTVLSLVLMLFASAGFATECYKNPAGKTVCNNSNSTNAAVYNPNTGKATKSTTNEYGVHNTTTSNGGQAKTKNGKGVAQGPGGTTCVKTAAGMQCK